MKYLKHLQTLLVVGIITLAGWLVIAKSPQVHAAPVLFTVENTNDSGPGSLRQAILDANGNGNPADQDVIEFDIDADASGDYTIEPLSALTITQSVLIDGYSQGDAEPNTTIWPEPFDGTLRVIIDNTSSAGIVVTGNNVTLQGLVLNNQPIDNTVDDPNITVTGASGFQIFGSYLGTSSNGMQEAVDSGDETKSLVLEDAADANIGGPGAAERNLFGYCAISCIEIGGSGSTNIVVQGNYVGLGADGVTSLDTFINSAYENRSQALVITDGASDVTVGGTVAGEGNSFERNASGAILAEDSSLINVFGNRINYNAASSTNANSGIAFEGVTDSFIGSTVGEGKNIIAGNSRNAIALRNSRTVDNPTANIVIEGNNIGVLGDDVTPFPNYEGINIYDDTSEVLITDNLIHNSSDDLVYIVNGGIGVALYDNANDVSILGNSIYNNENEGILLENMNPEDSLDVDEGPNDGLNSPGYTQIVENGDDTEIDFTADLPAGDYRIEFFDNTVADPDFPGEGETFIDSVNITSLGIGLEEYSHTITGTTGISNMSLTATERNVDTDSGFGATSMFGTEGEEYNPSHDLAMTMSVTNLNDTKVVGSTISIPISVTNVGSDPINLGDFDESSLSGDYYFMVALSEGLTYSGITGTGVACDAPVAGGDVSFGNLFANHQDASILVCAFTGGTSLLQAGQDRDYTISALVTQSRIFDLEINALVRANLYDEEYAAYQAIMTDDSDIIDGFSGGGNDNYSFFSTSFDYSTDISVNKQLLNPEDFATGNTLNYEITVTNNGVDEIDLTLYNDSNPANGRQLFLDFLPEQFTFGAVSSNLDCLNIGDAGDAFGGLMANHSDHTVLSCAYNGGSNLLQEGDSETFTVAVEVVDDSNPVFYNHIFASVTFADPDAPTVGDLFSGGEDVIDGFYESGINNYSRAYSLPADISLETTLNNPEDVAPGATLEYTYTVTNNGPMPINPNVFDGSGVNPLLTSMFISVLPANLSFVSQSNPDISCLGPLDVSVAGPLFVNHPDHTFLLCTYNGPITSLAPTESVSTTFTVTADSAPDSFVIKTFTTGSEADDDYGLFLSFLNGSDYLDQAEDSGSNNFVLAAYTNTPDPGSEDSSGDGQGSNNANGGSGNSGLLDSTGQAAWVLLPVLLLCAAIGGLYLVRKRGDIKTNGGDSTDGA